MTSHMERIIDNDMARLVLEHKEDGRVFAHVQVYQWSKELYTMYLLAWADTLTALRKRGVGSVYAHAPIDDEKVLKFQVMFGFTPIGVDEFTSTGKQYYLSEVKL